MVIKADLKCKQTDFNLPLCQIEKVVKLTPSEYTEFVSNPLGYYDFLREFNAEKHEYLPDGIPCLLLIREGHKDGFIMTQRVMTTPDTPPIFLTPNSLLSLFSIRALKTLCVKLQ